MNSSSLTIAALSALGAGGSLLLYQCLNFSSYWWRRQTRRLMDACVSQSLTIAPSGNVAHGKLSGLNAQIAFFKGRGKREKSPVLRATITLVDAPGEIKVENEDLLTGVFRAFGNSDTELGEQEFDAAFWVEGKDPEALRAFLTPARRRALLRHLPHLPEARLAGGAIESIYRPLVPFYLYGRGREMLTHLVALAAAFSPDSDSDAWVEPAPVGILRHKVRRVAAVSFWLFLLFAAICAVAQESLGRQAGLAVSGVGLAACFAAYLAGEPGRAILQSFFAFLTVLQVAAVSAYFLGAFGSVHFSDAAAVLLSAFVGVSLCWGARHHLKRLSRYFGAG